MKKCWIWLSVFLLLSGCGNQEVFEQMDDVYQAAAPQAAVVSLEIPEDAAVPAIGSGPNHAIYFCDGYTMTVQTLIGGDLNRTLKELTGFPQEMLTVLQTRDGELRRYEGTWTCVGEGGDQVGRLVLLDDGAYHYAVTVIAPAELISQLRLTWDTLFDSVTLDRIET